MQWIKTSCCHGRVGLVATAVLIGSRNIIWALLLLIGVFSSVEASARICRVRHAVVKPSFDIPTFDRPQYVRAQREYPNRVPINFVRAKMVNPSFEQPIFVKPKIDPCAGSERVSIGGQNVSPTILDLINGNKAARRDPTLRGVIMQQVRPLGKASDPRRNLDIDRSILCCDGSGGGAVPVNQVAPAKMQTRTGRLQ